MTQQQNIVFDVSVSPTGFIVFHVTMEGVDGGSSALMARSEQTPEWTDWFVGEILRAKIAAERIRLAVVPPPAAKETT